MKKGYSPPEWTPGQGRPENRRAAPVHKTSTKPGWPSRPISPASPIIPPIVETSTVLSGLFLLKADGETPDGEPVLARFEEALYALAYSSAHRANGARSTFGDEKRLFYVCPANVGTVMSELRTAGARGIIVDYDPDSASFATLAELPDAG